MGICLRAICCFCKNKDDNVFYMFLQKQKIGAKLHIPLGRYVPSEKRLFRGSSTNDMKE
jgi:hypothetical protein